MSSDTPADPSVGTASRRTWIGRGAAGLALTAMAAAGVGRALPAAAQDATPAASLGLSANGVPTVTVTGHGSVQVPPDTAGITIGVDVIKPTLAEAQSEATAQATAVITAVKGEGIDAKDIQTSNYSVSIMRDYSEGGDPTQITGFEVMNQVNVTIRDLGKIGSALDAVVKAGANSIYNIYFYIDDPAPFESDARKKAVADAQGKAAELATAAGLKLGPVMAISEGSVQVPQPVFGRGGGGMGAAEAAAVPIQAGTNEVTADVTITYELAE